MLVFLNVKNYVFRREKQFKSLGSAVAENNERFKEILARILAGNRALHGLAKLLVSLSLSIELKRQPSITLFMKKYL